MKHCGRHYCLTTFLILFFSLALGAQTRPGLIRGRVTDAQTQAPIVGASVVIEGTSRGASTDDKGEFLLGNLAPGTYRIRISMLTYKPFLSEPLALKKGEELVLDAALTEQVSEMENVVVVVSRPVGTDAGLISQMREASLVASGVSAQHIARTQDKDASEIVRRIPGISIIDNKFIIVRGLAQRYNNTWINGAAVPSSEADTRAFSFDIIPSSQIENVMIVKSPVAEVPADFAGGFVQLRTKIVPENNSVSVSYGTGINTATHFKDFKYVKGSGTDFLGWDNGMRSFNGPDGRIDNNDAALVDRITREGFNNDWRVRSRRPLWDQKLNVAVNRFYRLRSEDRIGLLFSVNYSNSNKSLTDMENNQYGVYNYREDKPQANFKYTDDQYTNDVKLGAMLNLSWVPKPKGGTISKYEFRNIFNQLGLSRYTTREGWRNVSGYYEQQQDEYLYASRTAYTGQFAGEHRMARTKVDWNAAYSYSNRNQPDRRIIEREKNPENEIYEYSIDQGSVSRYFTSLHEHLVSAGANLSHPFGPSADKPAELRAGVYGEYKTRDYNTRDFIYKWNNTGNRLPDGFASLPADQIFAPENLGTGKLTVQDNTDNTDNYSASNYLAAAYAAVNVPLGRFNLYGGVRFERFVTSLKSYTQTAGDRTRTYDYDYNNLFPSANFTYDLTKKSLLRLAYGMSVNRPEFRELSPSTYYDFDMFSTITGNPELKQATIHNIDLRYELYPGAGETVSLSLFYKRFANPIEWIYVDAGGSYQFSFENALSADNYGVELEVRKDLAFMGMQNFTLSLNAAWIESKVHFSEESLEHDRPMQGQSPYLVNAGLFYRNPELGLSVGALYNRIGKRIVGIGRVSTSGGDTFNNNIPDMYETPRDAVDLTFGIRLSKTFELKGYVRDLLCQRVIFAQYPEFRDEAGNVHERTQITKSYDPGRSFSLSLTATF